MRLLRPIRLIWSLEAQSYQTVDSEDSDINKTFDALEDNIWVLEVTQHCIEKGSKGLSQ